MPDKDRIGEVTYVHAGKCMVKILLTGKLSPGDTILISKDSSETKLKVESLSIEGIEVNKGFEGDMVEIKVDSPIEQNSSVYKL